jgi:predicted helicase
MRKKLLDDFDLIYILNLHGDAKRPKITKDGKKDENVFDIMQGVAIAIFVKPEKQIAKQIFYQELIGLREEKYKFLDTHDVSNVKWIKLEPEEPYCFFVPKKFKAEKKYKNFVSIKDIFRKTKTGAKSHRDKFLISSHKEDLRRKLIRFIDKSYPEELLIQEFNFKDTGTWNLKVAREKIKHIDEDKFLLYAYRPFDDKWTYLNENIFEVPRLEINSHLILKTNIAIVTTKQIITPTFQHVFVSNKFTDICLISLNTKESTYVFPLWLYASDGTTENQLSISTQPESKISNIKKEIIDLLSSSYKKLVSTEEIFYYIYAVLYSNIYREKYLEFLKIDFPKIPFTNDYKLFKKFSEIGKQLIELHLLKSDLLNNSSSKFEGNDNGLVKEISYNINEKRIYINKNQYFTNIEPEVWNYFIGGYQVLYKWLKDRENKYLNDEEIKTYIKIIEALKQTIKLQKKIDKFYPTIEKHLIIFKKIALK